VHRRVEDGSDHRAEARRTRAVQRGQRLMAQHPLPGRMSG
jgi:hypothetical protein